MLLLLPIVFSMTTVYSTSRISESGFQAVNFAQAKERRKLNGSVIKEVDVRSEDECSLQCVRNERCLSYNFKNTKNESGSFACELSNSDRFSGFGNFTDHDNFTYRGIQVKIPIFDDFFFKSTMLVSLNLENLYDSYVNNNYNISRQRKKGHYMYSNHHHHPCLKPSFRVRVETRYNDRCAKGAVKLYHYFEESLYRNSRYNDMLEK